MCDGVYLRMSLVTDSDPLHHPNSIGKVAGCARSCLAAALVIPTLYLLIVIVGWGWVLFNQLKWNSTGSSNYTITVENDVFAGVCLDAGNFRIPVRNGKPAAGFERFSEFTIEKLFEKSYLCGIPRPFYSCSIDYDSDYGYPAGLAIYDTSFGSEDCFSIRVLDVQIDR